MLTSQSGDESFETLTVGRSANTGLRQAPELPPLWLRIITGKSIGWRIRWVRNRMRWMRRRRARRWLQWLALHPEIRRAAHRGRLRDLVVLLAGSIRQESVGAVVLHRSTVDVSARVVTCGGPDTALVTHVTLSEPEQTDAVLSLSSDASLVTVQGNDWKRTTILAPVDLSVWSPVGFPIRPSTGRVTLRRLLDGGDERIIRRRLLVARRARAVVCEPRASASPEVVASWIVRLAASGTPLIGELSDPVLELLGPEFGGLICGSDSSRVRNDDDRELYSVQLRRCAVSNFSPRGRWRQIGQHSASEVVTTPRVSVLLASNRQVDVVSAARQVAAQRGVDVQLVVGLHGDHMPETLADELAAVFTGDLVVRRLPEDLNLGQVLNALTAEADRPLVSKWDDDDWYDVDHLADLVLAMEYSGAGLVGKAAEFVRLESIDITLRRFSQGAERYSTTIAGGTLMTTRANLQRVGWADAPKQVDRRLIEALQGLGLKIYRTHGYGYVLRRQSSELGDHTWKVGDEYFLRQADAQRRGLDLDFAGFARVPS